MKQEGLESNFKYLQPFFNALLQLYSLSASVFTLAGYLIFCCPPLQVPRIY
jgi:hypothetical protein